MCLGFLRNLPKLLIHLLPEGRARVNSKAHRRTSQAERVAHTASYRRHRVTLVQQQVVVVQFENQRDLAGMLSRPRLDEPQWRGVAVATGLQGQPEMIQRIVGWGIGREAARRTMLEALVNWQDH